MFTLVVLWRGITRNDRGSPGCSCRRGVTRPHSCSLARYGRQTKSVVLCISEKKNSPPQRTARSNPRAPTAPSIIDTVASQDTRKRDFERAMGAISTGTMNVLPNQWAANGSKTIEFFSYGRNTPPTTSMALWWDTPPRNRGLTRTFCRCVSRPASYQPPPQMYNIQPLPTNVLERHQRSISRRHE